MDPTRESVPSSLTDCRLTSMGRVSSILAGLAAGGLLLAGANTALVDDAGVRFMQAYLVAFAFVLSVSLGALFFVLIQFLTRAGWSVVVRRFAEVLCLNIWVVAVLFAPIGWSVWRGDGRVYRWAASTAATAPAERLADAQQAIVHENGATVHDSRHALGAQGDHVVAKPFLRPTRFILTWIALLAIWTAMATTYYRTSVRQDENADFRLTLKMERWSGGAMVVFGFSLTLGAFDLLMSLDPSWYSTIFGVYFFAGCAVGGLATILLVTLLLMRSGRIPQIVSQEVQLDLGRLLFAFVFFWAYIAFSQYMLLWYAHQPETTAWLVRRGASTATGYTNTWGWLALTLLFGHFVLPFCGFMSRHIKAHPKWMMFWCTWMLLMHYLDLYWIVIPETHPAWTIGFIEIGVAVAVISIYALTAIRIASRASLFPIGDPRMAESLHRHPAY